MEIVEITHAVLSRAARPLPTALGTLDAIHLATALLWKEHTRKELSMATRDGALAIAAKASGLRTIGRSLKRAMPPHCCDEVAAVSSRLHLDIRVNETGTGA